MKYKIAILTFFLAGLLEGFSQSFVNLNFENAQIKNLSFSEIPATNAFPGWTINTYRIYYDDLSLSGESVSIFDISNILSLQPIQGKYFAFLTSGNYPGTGISISMGQTGTVPVSAESIIFWGSIGGMQVTFDGQPLNFLVTGSIANYDIYTADISSYAGQTGQLLFTLPPYVINATLDNIQFSASPVPEPSELALVALGISLLGFRRWQNSSP